MSRTRTLVVALLAVALIAATPASALAASVAEQLAALKKEVRAAGRAYDRAYWELDEAEVRLDKLDAQMEITDRELEAATARLQERVGIMYRNSTGLGMLDVVLASDSYEDMVTRIDFLYRIGRSDANAIAEVEALQAKLASQRAQLAAEQKNHQKALSSLRKERDALKKRLAAKQGQYDALRRKAQGSTFSPGVAKGSRGWVFPVQGVSYYANTWGASRSGGRRRHKGTDIMAGMGTPCVAVLSGTVRAKEGGLGGKTIWLTADNGDSFYYAHLNSWVVRSGRVKKGQLIGTVGDTGNAQGGAPHLHFEFHPGGGEAVNPYPYLRACE